MKTWTKFVNQVAIIRKGTQPKLEDFHDCCPCDHQDLYGAIICRDTRVEWENNPPPDDCKDMGRMMLRAAAVNMDDQGYGRHYRIIKRVVTCEESVVESEMAPGKTQ